MPKHAAPEETVERAHQRARNEAISVIDSEVQRLAYCYMESSAPVREDIGRRIDYLSDLMRRLTGAMTDQLRSEPSACPLWEADHPYYCSESNFYVGGAPKPGRDSSDFAPWDHVEFANWADFGWKDSDPDMNLLFRWDWEVPDPADYDGEEVPSERLLLFWMLQRKGRFMVTSFPVWREQEAEIRAWLAERAQTLAAIWDPIEIGRRS